MTARHRCSQLLNMLVRLWYAFFSATAPRHQRLIRVALYARVLVDSFIDVTCCQTPVFIAAVQGHASIVSLLLQAKADVRSTTVDKVTALHAASAAGHLGTVRVLLEAKASAQAVDARGNVRVRGVILRILSCLQACMTVAAERGHTLVVNELLEAGADLHHTNENGAVSAVLSGDHVLVLGCTRT